MRLPFFFLFFNTEVTIISTKRMRKRYIAFQIQSSTIFQRNQVIKAIQKTCYEHYDQPCTTYDFFLTRYKDNIGILRCYHTEKDRAIELLTSINTIQQQSVTITTIATSGTIKTLIKKHLDGNSLKE